MYVIEIWPLANSTQVYMSDLCVSFALSHRMISELKFLMVYKDISNLLFELVHFIRCFTGVKLVYRH